MLRAVGGRIQHTMSGLPPPFRLHVPRLNLVSSPEVRHIIVSCYHCQLLSLSIVIIVIEPRKGAIIVIIVAMVIGNFDDNDDKKY